MITSTVDSAIATTDQLATVSQRAVVAQPVAGGPTNASIRSAVAATLILTTMLDSPIRGGRSANLTTVDGAIADQAGWVKEPVKTSSWTLLSKLED